VRYYKKRLVAWAKRNVLAGGQGARKRKPVHRRGVGSKRHKRAVSTGKMR